MPKDKTIKDINVEDYVYGIAFVIRAAIAAKPKKSKSKTYSIIEGTELNIGPCVSDKHPGLLIAAIIHKLLEYFTAPQSKEETRVTIAHLKDFVDSIYVPEDDEGIDLINPDSDTELYVDTILEEHKVNLPTDFKEE